MAAHAINLVVSGWDLRIAFWDPINSVIDHFDEPLTNGQLDQATAVNEALTRIDQLTSTGDQYDGWEAGAFYLVPHTHYGVVKL